MKIKSHKKIYASIIFFMGFFCLLTSCTSIGLRNTVESQKAENVVTNAQGDRIIPDFQEKIQRDCENKSEASITYEEYYMEKGKIISEDAVRWTELYEKKYGEGSADKIIMSSSEIAEYNKNIAKNCPTVFDMTSPPERMSGNEVREMIHRYSMPQGEKYDRHGNHIKDEKRRDIDKNRNLEAIGDTVEVKYGIITKRCDLKGFPTELGFYNQNDTYYSSIQETELIVGFPVLILHESADGEFVFVRSYYYAGWIPSSCAAEWDFAGYMEYASPEKFITITEPELNVNDVTLSMGCVLPYVSEDETYYYALLPADDGVREKVSINKSDACYGYMEYTMRNYYRQAFSFLGTMYGWGGSDGGVDCSGFVCAVFRSFGIYLPRNTGEQSKYNGESINLSGLNASSAASVLSDTDTPASVHRKGHVMLYLGEDGGSHYIIHAPQGGERVCVTKLSLPGELTNLCLIK